MRYRPAPSLSTPTKTTAIKSNRLSLAAILLSSLILPLSAEAHEGASHSHDQAEPDTRQTPRSADTHTTGTLPRANGESSTAESKVEFTIRGDYRYVTANGMPDHATGKYPNKGNPNVLAEQKYSFKMPLNPTAPKGDIVSARDVYSDRGIIFGVALNGVPYEPATGMNWTADGIRRGGRAGKWVYEAIGGSINFGIDHANAHTSSKDLKQQKKCSNKPMIFWALKLRTSCLKAQQRT